MKTEESKVLALNSGSSSLKFGLYQVGASKTKLLLSGEAEGVGEPTSRFHAKDSYGNVLLSETSPISSQQNAVARIGTLLDHAGPPDIVGHRVVHGGQKLEKHCVIDATVLRLLEEAAAFAPLHAPAALTVIRFAQEHFLGRPQVACLDTVFHVGLPDVAKVVPISRAFEHEGIRRYGFHGLSCESILHQLGDDRPDRVVIAHLGSGASVTAVRGGKSIDTSMGLTPTGGVVMGTRSGDLDPGILIYLAREKHFDAGRLEHLVDQESGLRGISGIGSDMRALREAAPSNPNAQLAIDIFCYSVRKQIAAMIAALGGIDLLVFAGGIGENDCEARAEICAGLSWIGIGLDEARNRSANNPISDTTARCRVLVLPSQEDEQIARHCWSLMR